MSKYLIQKLDINDNTWNLLVRTYNADDYVIEEFEETFNHINDLLEYIKELENT